MKYKYYLYAVKRLRDMVYETYLDFFDALELPMSGNAEYILCVRDVFFSFLCKVLYNKMSARHAPIMAQQHLCM